MASKKGIAITAAIVAAIVGASFLIWLMPQSSPGAIIAPPRTDSEIISDVYARHNDLADSVESSFAQWTKGNVTSEEMLDQISNVRTEITQMQSQIESASPAAEWQQSFDLYEQALDVFSEYLDAVEGKVESGGTGGAAEIEELRIEWRDYVDQSVAAMPIGR
ncbi:MAG: hypothetical protein MN733_26365 [Nitrososphaera sp.]|nr:hypothetical protein [Nitrososphaera sp.]